MHVHQLADQIRGYRAHDSERMLSAQAAPAPGTRWVYGWGTPPHHATPLTAVPRGKHLAWPVSTSTCMPQKRHALGLEIECCASV